MMDVLTKMNRLHVIIIILVFLVVALFLEINNFHSCYPILNQHSTETETTKNLWMNLSHLKYSNASHTKLGNFTDFHYKVNSDVCKNEEDIYMLILVGSKPNHHDLRDVLRKFFKQPNITGLTFKMVFLFGQLESYEEQLRLQSEIETYGDIIQGNFVDSYHNLTLRDLMGFRWTWQSCSQARYVLRMDDDTAFDIYKTVDALDKCCSNTPIFIGCFYVWKNYKVARDGPYQLTTDEFPNKVYDDFCAGWMYTLNPLMAYLLDWASINNKYYWLNDAYITGSLVKALSIKHLHLDIPFTFHIKEMKSMLAAGDYKYECGPTESDPKFMEDLLKHYEKRVH